MVEAVNTFAVQQSRLVQAYVRQVWNVWKTMTPADWWNDAVVLGAAAQAARFEIAFLEAMARLGISYADTMLALGDAKASGRADTSWVAPRTDTTTLDVMMRPFDAYRHEATSTPSLRPDSWDEYEGPALDEVTGWLRAALDRLRDIANTDAQMTANRTVLDRFKAARTSQYRRVIHPELSRTGTCALCAVASTRVYNIRELMPLHSNCKCGVAPITDYKDVGAGISDEDLQRFYELAGSTRAADLKEIRLQVDMNGELGPVLRRDSERSGRTVSDWTPPDRATTREQAARIIRNYKDYSSMYGQVMRTGEKVSRRIDGRTVVFKPGVHNAQARTYYNNYIQQLRTMFPGL